MTKKALIYTRVSTEEQGTQFSLPDQKERLERFCGIKNIEILGHFREEHSAKNFENRKVFQQLLKTAKKNRKEVDYVLFVRWDRFSRNVTQSFQMVRQLSELGIEANAIEGWIDHSVPENLLMLAFYLASPEVENTRRGLNVKRGIRQATKEGRWTRLAPKGYVNGRDERNKPLCIPDNRLTISGQTVAALVQSAFADYATGTYGIVELARKYRQLGLGLHRSAMSNMLRSPIYMGKLYVPAWKDEPDGLYDGLHEPLITAELFYKVQDVLNGNRPQMTPSKKAAIALPLRGVLQCPACGKTLTGSGSRSRSGERHFYYHCREGCKTRLRADRADDLITDLLKHIKPKKQVLLLYIEALKDVKDKAQQNRQIRRVAVGKEISILQEKIDHLEEKFITNQITLDIYEKWHGKYVQELNTLKDRQHLSTTDLKLHLQQVTTSLPLLTNLDHYYQTGTSTFKSKLIRSIFIEKLTLEKSQVRTAKVHPAIIDLKAGRPILSDENHSFPKSDGLVRYAGFEPATPTLSR